MIKDMNVCEHDAVLAVADKMVTAAKTAPRNWKEGRQGILHKRCRKCR